MTTKTIAIAAVSAAMAVGATASVASASTAWTNTPRHVESLLLDRYATSDGEPFGEVQCRGVWTDFHARTRRGMEFHRFRCSMWDDVNRHFVDRAVASGRASFRLTELACNDSQSEYACP